MLQVENVSYRMRGGFSVRNLSFSLESGYIMSLLGKNGSGKSTILRLLYGILCADEGKIFFEKEEIGRDLCRYRNRVALVGEEQAFLNHYSLQKNVEILGLLYETFDKGLWEDYMSQFEFHEEEKNNLYGDLSTGQKRRFELAFTLARKPKLLLLDEPTANLDPVFRMKFMELLQKYVENGDASVMIATHILGDVEDMSDYIGVVNNGEMVLFGDCESLFEQQGERNLEQLLIKAGKR